MNALVVYESVYGNTRAVAEAVAQGLGGEPRAVSRVPVEDAARAELLVVGGPTHMHGMTTRRSRELAAEVARADGKVAVDADADAEPGLRSWLALLPDGTPRLVAVFDTRLNSLPLLTGSAAHGISRRLRRHGHQLLAAESFLVEGSEGPLVAGELERARLLGAQLATELAARTAANRPSRSELASIS